MRIYIASPFFNEEQLRRVEEIKKILDKREISYFSPKDHNYINPDATAKEKTVGFNKNISEIAKCNLMIAVTNDKDAGTMFEAGFAFAIRVPIVYFWENDDKSKSFNLMLAESSFSVITSYKDLLDYNFLPSKYKGEIE